MKIYNPTKLSFGLGLILASLTLWFILNVNFYIGLIVFTAGVGLFAESLKKPKK